MRVAMDRPGWHEYNGEQHKQNGYQRGLSPRCPSRSQVSDVGRCPGGSCEPIGRDQSCQLSHFSVGRGYVGCLPALFAHRVCHRRGACTSLRHEGLPSPDRRVEVEAALLSSWQDRRIWAVPGSSHLQPWHREPRIVRQRVTRLLRQCALCRPPRVGPTL